MHFLKVQKPLPLDQAFERGLRKEALEQTKSQLGGIAFF